MEKKKIKKIYVLDTSVILYDFNAINNFEENDIAVPITVLEELDNFKKGNDTKNFAAREFIRFLDKLSGNHTLQDWIPIKKPGGGSFKVVMHYNTPTTDASFVFSDNKADHKILNAAISLKEEFPNRTVVLVTKDINLRLKAKALDLHSEDYLTGKVKDLKKLVETGKQIIDDVDNLIIKQIFEGKKVIETSINEIQLKNNAYYILRNGKSSALSFYNPKELALAAEKLATGSGLT